MGHVSVHTLHVPRHLVGWLGTHGKRTTRRDGSGLYNEAFEDPNRTPGLAGVPFSGGN